MSPRTRIGSFASPTADIEAPTSASSSSRPTEAGSSPITRPPTTSSATGRRAVRDAQDGQGGHPPHAGRPAPMRKPISSPSPPRKPLRRRSRNHGRPAVSRGPPPRGEDDPALQKEACPDRGHGKGDDRSKAIKDLAKRLLKGRLDRLLDDAKPMTTAAGSSPMRPDPDRRQARWSRPSGWALVETESRRDRRPTGDRPRLTGSSRRLAQR